MHYKCYIINNGFGNICIVIVRALCTYRMHHMAHAWKEIENGRTLTSEIDRFSQILAFWDLKIDLLRPYGHFQEKISPPNFYLKVRNHVRSC